MTLEALRSRQGDAFGAGGIAGDRPTKCGVDRPGLKHALGVIYLSAAPSHNQRRLRALPSVPWCLTVHAGDPRQGLAKQFTNAPLRPAELLNYLFGTKALTSNTSWSTCLQGRISIPTSRS
jgi:hypothetical protein